MEYTEIEAQVVGFNAIAKGNVRHTSALLATGEARLSVECKTNSEQWFFNWRCLASCEVQEVAMQRLTSWATLFALMILSVSVGVSPAAVLSTTSTTLNLVTANQAVPAAALDVSGIYSVAACRDTTTVTVSGSSSYATNRIRASVSNLNSDGDYVLLQQVTSANFGSGSFWIPVVLDYHTQPEDAGTQLQVIVQLQRSSGSGFTDLGDPVTTYIAAADRLCFNQCSVTISTSDRAPTNGVITLRTRFGSWFRPEGWLQGAMSVSAGQTVQMTFADVSCDAWARVWFYPATGQDRTPRMLPSQYWPSEYGTAMAGASAPYAASFAKGLPATKPLESDDPYAPR